MPPRSILRWATAVAFEMNELTGLAGLPLPLLECFGACQSEACPSQASLIFEHENAG
jgi:hypothetical protein